MRPVEPRILNLDPLPDFRGRAQPEFLSYLGRINAEHLDRHPHESDLDARIKSYELAARMQVAAKEALDISRESKAVHRFTASTTRRLASMARRCLIARRMVERGVRFVQIFTGNQTWDHHNGIVASLPRMCRRTDKPAAALVHDLKLTGLLDTTLVHWGGEMGRLPVIENEKNIGRDHNTYGFSMWLAGGGVKGWLRLRRDRRVRSQSRQRTSSTTSTITPRCCTSSGSTKNKSRLSDLADRAA